MKNEVTPEQAANNYIGKAIVLLDTACGLFQFCDPCPMRDRPDGECLLKKIKQTFY